MKRKSNQLIDLLKARGETLALAESMTAGLATHRLAGVKGTCDVLTGSIVCYNEKVKTGLLCVSAQLVSKHTAESQQVTDALARKLHSKIKADVCAAITGLAARGGSETKTKPVGTVFFSVYYKHKIYRKKTRYKGSPIEVRQKATDGLYTFIIDVVNNL